MNFMNISLCLAVNIVLLYLMFHSFKRFLLTSQENYDFISYGVTHQKKKPLS